MSVDVVIPSYQYGRFLRDCVTSVVRQDAAELRILIIDNASTDNSVEVARQLAAEDPRVEVVARRRNLGPHASFNVGIDWASSRYFLILCADDLLAPGALARATSVMEQHPTVHLTYGTSLCIPEDGSPPKVDPGASNPAWRVLPGRALLERFCRTGRNHIPGPTAIVRTSVQKAVGYYRPSLPHTDDLEMWMRFACVGSAAETGAIQAFWRSHPSNQCATVANIHAWNLEFEAAFESFFTNEGARVSDSASLRRLARRSLAERAYWGAFSALCRRQWALSLELAGSALRLRPDMAVLPPLGYFSRRPDLWRRSAQAFAAAMGRFQRRAG